MTQADVALLLFLSLAQQAPAPATTGPVVERCHVAQAAQAKRLREICVVVHKPKRVQVAGLK